MPIIATPKCKLLKESKAETKQKASTNKHRENNTKVAAAESTHRHTLCCNNNNNKVVTIAETNGQNITENDDSKGQKSSGSSANYHAAESMISGLVLISCS
jgi:hypothetical protein